MSREAPAPFCEGLGVRVPWATLHTLHWCLDMTFNEDQSRIRKGEAPENFALLRRVALSLLKNIDPKLSVAKKRYRASLEESYLLQLLASASSPVKPATW